MRQVPLIIEPDPDDPDFAAVMVDATIAGRPYRLLLDTGAARTQLDADEYTSGLRPVGEASSFGSFEPVTGQRTFTRHKAVAVDLSRVNSTLEYPMILILGYPTMRQAGWVFDFPAERWTLKE